MGVDANLLVHGVPWIRRPLSCASFLWIYLRSCVLCIMIMRTGGLELLTEGHQLLVLKASRGNSWPSVIIWRPRDDNTGQFQKIFHLCPLRAIALFRHFRLLEWIICLKWLYAYICYFKICHMLWIIRRACILHTYYIYIYLNILVCRTLYSPLESTVYFDAI